MEKETQKMEENEIQADNLSAETDISAVEEPKEEPKEDELAKLKDDYLRLHAEFDNYRRRTTREKLEIMTSGGENVIKTLLPVLDDTDRALVAMPEGEQRTGIELIVKKLRDTLAAHGLSEIEALGAELDTDLHEAVARTPVEGQKGKVVDVAQKGYKMGEKVIRHAKCVIGE